MAADLHVGAWPVHVDINVNSVELAISPPSQRPFCIVVDQHGVTVMGGLPRMTAAQFGDFLSVLTKAGESMLVANQVVNGIR